MTRRVDFLTAAWWEEQWESARSTKHGALGRAMVVEVVTFGRVGFGGELEMERVWVRGWRGGWDGREQKKNPETWLLKASSGRSINSST